MDKTYDMSTARNIGSNNSENEDFVALMNDLNDDLLRSRLD